MRLKFIMNRGLLNLVIDLLAACCLIVMLATGYILRFPLPPTTNRTHELWGMSRHAWGSIHSWASLFLLAALVTHLILHWDWLFTMIRRRFTSIKAPGTQQHKAGIYTGLGLILIGCLFAWATHRGVRVLETPLHPTQTSNTVNSPYQWLHQRQ